MRYLSFYTNVSTSSKDVVVIKAKIRWHGKLSITGIDEQEKGKVFVQMMQELVSESKRKNPEGVR